MADEFSKEIKSNRLLQSLRYTMAAQDNQEAFTKVLDLNASEIYTQENYIPSSSLPFSSSVDHLSFITASIDGSDVNIAQYYFELSCSRSSRNFGNSKSEVWFTISGSGYDPIETNAGAGIGSTIIESLQQTNWLSNKYASSSLALNNAESGIPGYNVLVKKNGVNVNSSLYQFDYKTGVLEFVTNNDSPTTTDIVTVTGYRYVGKTLAQETFGGGSGTGFPFSGSAIITGSLLVSGSGVNFSDTSLTASILSASNLTATTISGVTNATFQSASIDHLTVNVLISGSTIITSGSNTFGDDTSDTQTLIGTTKISGSAQVTGSLSVSGSLSIQGIADVSASIAAASGQSGIFTQTGSFFATTNTLQITGSTLESSPVISQSISQSNAGTGGGAAKYALVVSQSAWHYSDNVGVPTSNAWKTGLDNSYFNNFDHNTDTAEILRFVAGLLSSSAPDASPNTQTYNNITPTQGNTQTGTRPSGYVPLSFTDPTVTYLNSKGFANTGELLFNGITTIRDYNGSGLYKKNYSSVAGGSSTVSSSADTELFGLGSINTAFAVSGTLNWFFSSGSNKVETSTSQSENLLTRTGAGTSDGLTIGNIQTANPAVIPVAFQDGKFANILEAEISDIDSTADYQTTESVGYYHLSASISIRSGSSGPFSPLKTNLEEIFYAPVDELNSNITLDTPQSLSQSGDFSASLSATSRSFSGAPYLLTAEWEVSNSIHNVFKPLYAGNTTQVSNMSLSSVEDSGTVQILKASSNHDITLETDNGSINTSNVVFNPAGVGKNTGTPAQTDLVRLSGSVIFTATASAGSTNIQQSSTLSDTGFAVVTSGKNRASVSSNLTTDFFQYFDSGSYNQLLASGSMAYYGRAQGYDPATATGTTETFLGEDFRRKVDNTLLTVTGSTAYGTSYSIGLVDPLNDLQVKPGFLIKPGGTYKYWIPTAGSSDYRYYAREFDTGGSTFSSMTINIGKVLVKWTDTSTSGAAIGIVFASGATSQTLIDVGDNTEDDAGSTTPQAGKNPFSTNINIFSNNHSSPRTGNTYSISTAPGKNITLNASFRKFIVIIRYKGDESPVTTITTAYQA